MSKIEWTDETLNCVTGCTQISPGCKNCYAKKMTKRLKSMGHKKYKSGFDVVRVHPQAWNVVSKWKKPRRVFVNSMSDTFHEEVGWWFIQYMFEQMNRHPQHTFMLLTKRSERMEDILNHHGLGIKFTPNIWMGVSVETIDYLYRIEHLKQIDAKVRFISFEPLLGPVGMLDLEGIHWVIIGGESGPHARPMNEYSVMNIIGQCNEHDPPVPVFYKQKMVDGKKVSCPEIWGRQWTAYPGQKA